MLTGDGGESAEAGPSRWPIVNGNTPHEDGFDFTDTTRSEMDDDEQEFLREQEVIIAYIFR